MKKILITGANSYIGDNIKKYLEATNNYSVDILDMLSDEWKKSDFSIYQVVINVCAIVHRFDNPDESLYFKVNRDLAFEIAKKAKESKVKQFIQFSTVGVYGIELGEMNSRMGFNPKSPYERSKYEADLLLEELKDESFKVCVIRPPMIYGNGCRGNFPKLVNFALKTPVFPSRKNKRDMIYIDNLSDFVLYAVDNELNEVCYPRDNETICVSSMIKEIASLNGKKVRLWWIFNPFVALLYRFSHSMRSVFGDNYCTDEVCKNSKWVAPVSVSDALKKMYSK